MKKSWILYGPSGTGKTANAAAIARHLKLHHIHDEWDGTRATFVPLDTLHITNNLPERYQARGRRVLNIGAALLRLGDPR